MDECYITGRERKVTQHSRVTSPFRKLIWNSILLSLFLLLSRKHARSFSINLDFFRRTRATCEASQVEKVWWARDNWSDALTHFFPSLRAHNRLDDGTQRDGFSVFRGDRGSRNHGTPRGGQQRERESKDPPWIGQPWYIYLLRASVYMCVLFERERDDMSSGKYVDFWRLGFFFCGL